MASVLVTGSSSGFGDLIVRTLASHGHRVYASMRETAGKNATVAQALADWAASNARAVRVVDLDTTSDRSVAAAVNQVLGVEGSIDVVINNAAGNAAGPLEAFSISQMAALLDVNVLGPMRVNKAVLPGMRERRSGLIVWVTSTLGRVLAGRGGLYAASKWAAEGFAESLHHQLAPFGIDVVILEPGSFPTPIHFKSMDAEDEAVAADYAVLAAPPRAARVNPNPPPPDPQEVADAVLELVESPAGSRPLRRVVGPVFTDGVTEYNQVYDRLRSHMEEVLRRPDQAITWTRQATPPPRGV